MMKDAIEFVENEHKSLIYGYSVKDPSRYGVVEFDQDKNIISIEEKPNKPSQTMPLSVYISIQMKL